MEVYLSGGFDWKRWIALIQKSYQASIIFETKSPFSSIQIPNYTSTSSNLSFKRIYIYTMISIRTKKEQLIRFHPVNYIINKFNLYSFWFAQSHLWFQTKMFQFPPFFSSTLLKFFLVADQSIFLIFLY